MSMSAISLRRATTTLRRLSGAAAAFPPPAPPSSSSFGSSSESVQTQLRRSPLSLFQSRGFRGSPGRLLSARGGGGGGGGVDEIGPDTILFEGCDYNHWLIVMDFPKENKPTPEEMVRTYEETCARGLNISLEEAKLKMYACSTTTYTGFQALMTEEQSERFNGLPGVVFVLPDSYIDPQNKEYGGDKYMNGTIIPRPPPIEFRRQQTGKYRDQPRFDQQRPPLPPNNDARQGPPQGRPTLNPQQSYNPYSQQQFGSPPNFPPPPQQNYGPPGRGGPYQQTGPGGPPPPPPPQQYQGNYGPPPNQGGPGNYYPPGQGSYGAPPNQQDGGYGNYGQGSGGPQGPGGFPRN